MRFSVTMKETPSITPACGFASAISLTRAQKEMGHEDTDISISGIQLCHYLDAVDRKLERALGDQSLAKDVKKRKRLETPPEAIRAGDEAKYAEQEERAAKRADHDMY
ncbi:hypothetical protein PENANT_c118G02661 [Penicillium antarcticum]|uniref:Uncharacterized protein n=1 Tax=Penicillium antarcticum TaxID=416450 RepID=A0A1V6PIG4_9EURO|nr:uncharacterized protein N7508_011037 [Penicillium antarcticum]KAJ5288262.1 hypothetical protein N7508_011037 [Penicillium antarcticum]OQD76771.1 hypothetical protein PENANT_c118G02661 [Penicillium antarcticum]